MKSVSPFQRANLLSVFVFTLAVFSPRTSHAWPAPTITTQPTNRAVLVSSNAIFTVVANGHSPLRYRWSFNGTNLANGGRINGATNATLMVSNVVAGDAGPYRVAVTNGYGSVTSVVAALTVLFHPGITQQPQSQIKVVGDTASFVAGVSGTPPISCRWFFNGTLLAGGGRVSEATNTAFTITNLQTRDAGNYMLVATNSYGAVTSAIASLTVSLNLTGSVRYVSLNNPNPAWPYSDWNTAATNIQDAIDAADPGDKILVTNGVYQAGGRVVSGTTNRVAVTTPVSVASVNGPVWTWIDGGAVNRCVYLTNGVTLTGFALTNGTASGNGGGACCESASAVVADCVLSGNSAGDKGGGVYSGTLTNCIIAGNSCTFGGGAAASMLNNCTVTGNFGGYGAGAAWSTLNNCVVNSNTSWSIGGGAASSTLNNCTFTGNICDQHGGAGVYCTMTNCVMISNSSQTYEGGGVDSSTLYSCTLSNNSAGQWGGNAALSTLSHCLLTGGSAGMGGGAKDCTLNDCTLSNNGGYQGGGANGCTLSNCMVANNSALSSGGGLEACVLINSLVVSNWSTIGGGADGCMLTNCSLIGNSGGGPYTGQGGGANSSFLYNCLLAGNSSVRNGGGAVSSTLVNCTVTANSAGGDGGGVDSSALTNCIVFNNNSSINANYSGTNYMSWCCTMPLPTAGPGDTLIGVSNINFVPLFADAGNGNYRLYPGSPCINAGCNTAMPLAADLDGNARIVNGTVDLGAYEFQNYPFVEIQPTNQTVPLGQPSVSFSVFAVGPGTLTYQWRFNGTNVVGATNSTLTLTFVQYSQTGNYSVSVANSFGSALSSNAVLTVIPPTPPSFVSQPATNLTVPTGTNVTLAASATGAPPPADRWYFNGAALSDNSHYTGTAGTTLQVSNVQTNDTGNYWVVATNTGGAATSSVAAVAVLIPPAITLQPLGRTLPQGSNVTFNAAASGGAPLSYQWYFNGTPLVDGGQISGSATTNLAVSNIQFTNGGNYVLVVTNPVGSATSTAAALAVIALPAIVRQPANQAAQWGASAIFRVVAIGTPPLNYQWTLNSATLNGATNSVLLLTNLQPSQAGNYAVTITNAIGSVVSSNATLTVNLPPPGVPFITGFSPATAFPGATVTIFGTNFSSTAASNIVYFGAVQAAVISASVTNLVVTVPPGATFAPITETVGGLTAFSSALFLPTFPGDGTPVNSSTFAPRQNLSTPSGPMQTVIADMDGDGKPDLVVADIYAHVISIFQNVGTPGSLGTNSFAARVDLPAIGGGSDNPIGMTVADVDGDGKLDILICDRNANQIKIYRNISTPGALTTNSFAAPVALATSGDARHLRVADVDGDGKPDIVVADWGADYISIFRNVGGPGNLAFAPRVDFSAGSGIFDLVVADLDGDGKPDIAWVGFDVLVLRNTSVPGTIDANSFAAPTNFTALADTETITAVDVDGDGKRDLIIGSILGNAMTVLRNQSVPGTFSFATHVAFGAPGLVHDVRAGDINGDGKPDIILDSESASYLSAFQNGSSPGDFNASSLSNRVDFAAGSGSWGVSVGDLDGDGRPDVVLGNTYDGNISLYQNQQPFGGAPVIIAQPGNQTVPLNNTAQLSGTVMGQSPLGYQWFFNGTNLVDDGRIAGSATASLSISNALVSDSGNYWFVVTNSFGSATSAVAAVTVIIVPPAFAQQPQNQVAILGSNAVFSAGVGGSLPMAFQWFSDNGTLSDGGRISGSASNSFTIAGVQTNDAVNYWFVASNAAGSATSSVVNLTVVLPVIITQQPSNQIVAVGSMLALSTAANGSGPFGYQWYFNNSPLADNSRITGSATSSLTVSNAQTSDTGNYTVVVTNLLTAATSSVATVTVLVPPSITTQPLGRSTPLGLTNIFAAAASGAAPLSYQWRLNGADIPGATNTSYFIAAVGTNDLGVYQFVASNAVGVAVSSNAWLTVGPVAAWGFNGYNQCLVPPGLSNVTTIAGGYTYSLASRLDGSIAAWGNASGVTNSSWTNVIAVSASAGGALALRVDGSVVGSGGINSLSSKVYPSNAVAVAAGYQHGLALRAEGTVIGWGSPQTGGPGYSPAIVPPGLTHVIAIAAGYQHSMALKQDGTVAAWGLGAATNVPIGLSNVVAIAAGQTHSLALKSDGTLVTWGTGAATNIPAGLSNVMAIAAGGYLELRMGTSMAVRSNGTVVAWGATAYSSQTNVPTGLTNVVAVADGSYHCLALVNDGTPQILRQPAGGTAWSGRDWTLQVAAAGAAPLNYQWLCNGTNIDGATNATLLLPAIQSTSAGNYQVVVSNSPGVAASLAAPLAVMDSAPFLLTQPTNVSVYLGSRVALSTAVAGSGPLQYQWQFNGTNLDGATNDTLAFDRVHMTNAGNYLLLATNAFGFATSSIIKLTVQQLVTWGNNTLGATNMPPHLTNVAAISANFYGNIALRADGTVTIWGDSGYVATNTAAGISNVVEVGAGYHYYLVLKSNGRPYAWGYNLSAAFTNAVMSQSNIVALEAGNGTCALLKNDGSVVLIGASGVQLGTAASSLTNVVSLEPFDDGFIALRPDGTVYGYNGGFPPPSTVSNVLAISSGRYQGLAVKRDGNVQDWPSTLIPAGTTTIIAVAAASGQGPEFAVRSDGTIISGGVGIATNIPYGLANVLRLDAGYNHCLVLFSDRDFPPVFLHHALNTSAFVVSSKGNPQWFGQTNVTHDGTNAAQSALIGNNTASSMRLWVAGPITVSFWWKVSSETNHDFLSLSAGGILLTNISGETGWQQCTLSLPPGNQLLVWTYSKDGSGSAGQDAGWVDQLQLIPQPPVILTQPAAQQVAGGTNVTFTVSATGTPTLSYRWRKEGSTVLVTGSPSYTLSNVTRANSGTYSVVVTNLGGSVTSSNAILIVHVPQHLGAPVLQPDGSVLLISGDADGGTLAAADLANLQVQVSTNLVDWIPLPGALTLTNGLLQLQDPDTTGYATRFYRIIESW